MQKSSIGFSCGKLYPLFSLYLQEYFLIGCKKKFFIKFYCHCYILQLGIKMTPILAKRTYFDGMRSVSISRDKNKVSAKPEALKAQEKTEQKQLGHFFCPY